MRRPATPNHRAAWLLAPFFPLFAVFWVVPLLGGLRMAVYSDGVFGEARFVGLEHFQKLGSDASYFKAVKNTLVFAACSIVVIVPLAVVLAQLLRVVFARARPGLTFLLLLPGLTPPAVLALLFLLVFHGREGL